MPLQRATTIPADTATPGHGPVDDRGRPTELLDPASLDQADKHQAALRAALGGELADTTKDLPSLAAGSAGCLVKALMSLVILGVLTGAATWSGLRLSGPGRFISSLVVLALIVPLIRRPGDWAVDRLVTRRIARARHERVVQRAREHSVCAGCGYTLAGLTPEEDGCTVCPECGGAWKLAPR